MLLNEPESKSALPISLKHSSPNCKIIKEHIINYLNEMIKSISNCKNLVIINEI